MINYAYHVTSQQFIGSIRKRGLLPREHAHTEGRPAIFVEPDEEEADIYSEPGKTVMIRFPCGIPDSTKDGECVVYERIPPEEIEVKNGLKWVPLLGHSAS